MKSVYQARDGLEAHMVAGLLEQVGIAAQVRGDLLQGAVGELPAAGLASVWVSVDDEERAREVVAEYECQLPSAPADAPLLSSFRATPGGNNFLAGMGLGFVAGVLATLLLLR